MTSLKRPQIETDFFFIEPSNIKTPLSKILKCWLKNRNTYFINSEPFNKYYYQYKINESDSYTNTRVTRFQNFIHQELLTQFKIKTNKEMSSTINQQFIQLINHAITNDYWLQIIKNRFSSRNYLIDGTTTHQIYLQYIPNNKIELKLKFMLSGNATWYNAQWDEEDLDDPRELKISENNSQLFCGESIMQLEEVNNNIILKAKHAQATLFASAMRPAFLAPTLDELINTHLQNLAPDKNKDEKNILIAAKKYYINQCSAQSLQNIFISTNFYSEQFKTSKSYQLIKKIIKEKPIPGFIKD